MTVYDCNKLKNLLEMEVAALQSKMPKNSLIVLNDFKSWHTILLVAVYIFIIALVGLIFYYWRKRRRENLPPNDAEKPTDKENEKDNEPNNQSTAGSDASSASNSESDTETKKKEKSRNAKVKNWVRQKARPIFVHNEASLRRQQEKYKENERLREWYTMQNIEKWTKARRKIEKKREKKVNDQEKPKE